MVAEHILSEETLDEKWFLARVTTNELFTVIFLFKYCILLKKYSHFLSQCNSMQFHLVMYFLDKNNINLWCKHLLQEMKVAEVLKHSLSNATIPSQMTSHKLVFIMLEFDDIEYSALSDLDLYVVVWLNLLLHMYNIYVGNKDITTLYLNAFFILPIYLFFFSERGEWWFRNFALL